MSCIRNPLLNRPSTAPPRRTTATKNPSYNNKYTRLDINKNTKLKKYLSNLTGIEDALNELRRSGGVVLSSNFIVQSTLDSLREMRQTIKKFEDSNYRCRKDAHRIQPYLNALKKRVHNVYLGLADHYLAHKIEMMPEVSSTSARCQHLMKDTAKRFLIRVAKDGGVPNNNAMEQVFKLVKAQQNQAAKEEKLLANMAESLPSNVGRVIYKKKKEQIANKLMSDLSRLTYFGGSYQIADSVGLHPELLKSTKNGFVKYIIDAENMQTLRTNKDVPMLNLGPVSVLLGRLTNVMKNPEALLTEKQATAMLKLKESVRRRYRELEKKALQIGKQRRNERNAGQPRRRPHTAVPTPRPFPGRTDTRNTPPLDCRLCTRRSSFSFTGQNT